MSHETLMLAGALGGLAFLLVTLVLYSLACQLRTAIERHDLIRAAKLQRQTYLDSLNAHRGGGVSGGASGGGDEAEFNVDIVDDEDDVAPAAQELPPHRAAA